MDKIQRYIMCAIPMSICNFRCSYCYLTTRENAYQNKQAVFNYTPEHIGKAFTKERLGGVCLFNFCADGETLLTKDIDRYVLEVLKQGHYVEIVTNLSVTPTLRKILSWPKDILEKVTFKCSFHYIELKEKKLLSTFVSNVKAIWEAGGSASIEVTPHDELVPYVDEMMSFSLEQFGALPQITIARNDGDIGIGYLTKLDMDLYHSVWSQFNSPFWEFKRTIFMEKRKEFCYAGDWSLYVDFVSGDATQCYFGHNHQNLYIDLAKPIEFRAVGSCDLPHCYNGHTLLTLGCIPDFTEIGYGDLRDRTTVAGQHWMRPMIREFMNGKLQDSNEEYSTLRRMKILMNPKRLARSIRRVTKKR